MNSSINDSKREKHHLAKQKVPFLKEENEPRISLAVARSDEEPKLRVFSKEDRLFFLFLTFMMVIQSILNIFSSIIMLSDNNYCDVIVDNYQIMITLGILIFIITFLVMIRIQVFRKKNFGIMSTLMFFFIEAYFCGMVSCYFETSFIRFINILLLFGYLGDFLYIAFKIKERVSLVKSIVFVVIANILGYAIGYFSIEIEIYESFGSFFAGVNFNFFYIWLLKMIHLKKIHKMLDLCKLKFIAAVLIQIDMFFLTFFSIFFIGV